MVTDNFAIIIGQPRLVSENKRLGKLSTSPIVMEGTPDRDAPRDHQAVAYGVGAEAMEDEVAQFADQQWAEPASDIIDS